MDKQEVQGFIDTARRFVKLEVNPMVGTEGRDGNLEKIPALLKQAASIGLVAEADPASPGHDYGIWGKASMREGPAASLAMLKEIASSCAGIASCLHFSGLAAAEMDFAAAGEPAAVALFEDSWLLHPSAAGKPPELALKLAREKGRLILSGAKSMVTSAPGCKTFIVYASGDSGWERVLVPAQMPGLKNEDTGYRTGLAALKIENLYFESASLDAESLLPGRSPSGFLRRLFLGLAAISAGNARGAVESAAAYAHDRYQGLTKIENHPAIKLMLGDAWSRVSSAEAHLEAVAAQDKDDMESLLRAAAAKLRISVDCWQAVSDSLQVFGGYGYMEDYRMEKRLRDAMTLKVMCGKPDELKMFCSTKLTGGI